MPELPEVETVKNGIGSCVTGKRIRSAVTHRDSLRYRFDPLLCQKIKGQVIQSVGRRAKNLILQLEKNALIIHLGMTGALMVCDSEKYATGKHDHVVIELDGGLTLYYNDPRRFGYWLLCSGDPLEHECFSAFGPEPLGPQFTARYLIGQLENRPQPIKWAIMENRIVVGVGNIYACESLFRAGIRPARKGNSLTPTECERLVSAIQETLKASIALGGTTIRDYKNADGNPGLFAQELRVYQKEGRPCGVCGGSIKAARIRQRNSFYCTKCQK